MKSENVVLEKSFDFAVKIVSVCKSIMDEKKEYVLTKQLLRAGTSIGANIEEAQGGQSKKDFFAKITIAYKEARETKYWIRLLRATDFLTVNQSQILLSDCNELLKIIGSIQKSIRNL